MKKIYYNKLIRDKIPERIKEHGGDFKIKVLNEKEIVKELIKKVGEESDGLVGAKDRKGIVEELGDILDVIDEIKRIMKIKVSELAATRKKAFIRKGSFKKRIYLVWSSDTGYKTNERKYKTKK
jgi:predicted house-cleaning noncanonical NTP pyrophosphatase (MazG superfamily)